MTESAMANPAPDGNQEEIKQPVEITGLFSKGRVINTDFDFAPKVESVTTSPKVLPVQESVIPQESSVQMELDLEQKSGNPAPVAKETQNTSSTTEQQTSSPKTQPGKTAPPVPKKE